MEKFILSESFSVIRAVVRVQQGAAAFRGVLVDAPEVIPGRTCLTFVAGEHEVLTTVAVRQREECFANLQHDIRQSFTTSSNFPSFHFTVCSMMLVVPAVTLSMLGSPLFFLTSAGGIAPTWYYGLYNVHSF